MKIERAKQLFEQCTNTYRRGFSRYDVEYCFDGIKMKGPNDFDDDFNVPAILLFEELCTSHKKLIEHYDSFKRNLLKIIHLEGAFDEQKLIQLAPPAKRQKYKVYFEVFFQKANQNTELPFKRNITVNGMTFTWCSQKTMAKTFNDYQARHISMLNTQPLDIDKRRSLYFPGLTGEGKKNIHTVVVATNATNAYHAANLALLAFELVKNAINITQALGSQSIQLGGRRPASLTMAYTGICLAINVSDLNDSILAKPAVKIYEIPKNRLSFTNATNRMQLFRNIMKSFCDNNAIISKRVRSVVDELSLVYSTNDPGLRQLSCWRCLELATVKSGENRKEKDIIKIFQNYYSNKFWKQMGELVLKLRNTYVHQGRVLDSGGFSGDYYLNWSQQYAEKSLLILLYLYRHRSIWGSEKQINKFFDYYAEPNDSLKVAQQLLSARLRRKP